MSTSAAKTTEKTEKEEKLKNMKKVDILSEGDRFIIPDGMSYEEAHEALRRYEEEENTIVVVKEIIKCFPHDGAVCLAKVLKKRYGWTNLVPQDMGWFGLKRPSLLGVPIDFDKTIQVPWGNFTVPKIDGTITTGWTLEEEMPVFVISAEVKRKDEKAVAEIASEVRKLMKNESIYRGKNVRINFRDSEGDRKDFNMAFTPKFINMHEAHKQEAIYSESVENAIEINLFNPIRYSEVCRKQGIPLKRGIMLGGPFGTGKTLTAWKTAIECAQHNWTFVYLEDVRDLDMAINFARLYEPCVLFAEDVDRAIGPVRDSQIDRILNSLDGVTSKNSEILVVLTTNYLSHVNSAFLRPGRIDTIIEVTTPDEGAIVRMVRKYGQDKDGNPLVTGSDEELQTATKCLVGANAAFIRETVERSKLSAISHNGNKLSITPTDLAIAAKSMLPHIKLVNPEHGKGMFDEDSQMVDPIQMAGDILIQKMAEAIIKQVTNPKMLQKIVIKQMKRGGDPSLN